MFKKLLPLISVVLMLTFVLSACGTPAAEPAAPAAAVPTKVEAAPAEAAPAAGTLAVGIVLPTKDEPRWVQDETRFKDALKAAGYEAEILFSQGDSAKEAANVEALIAKGIKVLIICPQDGKAAAAAAEKAKAAGVKVIAYDRLITDTDAVDFFATFNSFSVGAAQGQFLVDKAGTGKGLPLYLYAGAASDNNAFVFFGGAWSVLQPKIADGTFVIKNSSEAVALQAKAELTRDEQAKVIGQVTTNWDFAVAKNLAEQNLTSATAADKGDVFILAPNDGTARSIADTFGADKDVKSYQVTGQDAEKASVQYVIDGKQSMTVFKDVRTLVKDAITTAVSFLKGETPKAPGTENNGKIDVPATESAVVTVTKDNVKAALIDSGYYPASEFTGLDAAAAVPAVPAGQLAVGIVLPTKDEPRWVQDETRFKDALKTAGYEAEILFSQGDSAKEAANVEALIAKGIKVLIICPQDGKAAAAAAEKAKAAGVKVIAYDRLITDTDAVDFFATFNSFSVGAAQGQFLVDKAGTGKGLPLYLYAGAASDNNAFVFFAGAWSVLQPKIADGTFVIKNSSEAVALQAKAELSREEQAKIVGQVTTNWDFAVAKNLAEQNLTSATAADKGDVFILAPNDGTARSIADTFGADKDVKSYKVTGQDAEKASVQYVIDGKQSMTVFKDVRTLVNDAITTAISFLKGETPKAPGTENNGKIDVPATESAVVTVTQDNVKAALIDSGYYTAADFTGLK
jgi:putative multiple sugar transport system substrate-binding protein